MGGYVRSRFHSPSCLYVNLASPCAGRAGKVCSGEMSATASTRRSRSAIGCTECAPTSSADRLNPLAYIIVADETAVKTLMRVLGFALALGMAGHTRADEGIVAEATPAFDWNIYHAREVACREADRIASQSAGAPRSIFAILSATIAGWRWSRTLGSEGRRTPYQSG